MWGGEWFELLCQKYLSTSELFSQKPDIVIIENHKKAIHLYKLTCPAERNIDARNLEKSNMYAHFTTDITHFTCKVNWFEVYTRNHFTLNTLNKFVKPSSQKILHSAYNMCKDKPKFLEPTLGDQEGYCLHLNEYTCLGRIINVLTHYLVACSVWKPCLFLCNKWILLVNIKIQGQITYSRATHFTTIWNKGLEKMGQRLTLIGVL